MEKSKETTIKRLDETVVNRIAAGEVIQRPSNAIKEMLENSLDAGSTSINITIKSGGLKMLKIVDNGHGIHQSDMTIVCERFTTSKLRDFADLKSISTFGFRGEALASISHVGHLSITSRTKTSKCAFKASYVDGKLISSLQPCAGNVGTQIIVEDLFYNVPTRRKAFKSDFEEQQKIANVVTKYSVHNSGISFCLRKADSGVGNVIVQTQLGATIQDNILSIYGSNIGKELLIISHEEIQLKLILTGAVTNANCSLKKLNFLLFINNRLIDCLPLKHALETIYQNFLPKGSHPFIYLSLQMPPNNLDVNVHPTKHQVHFLNEEEVIESVCKCVESKLLTCDSSRTFYTQKLFSISKSTGKNDQDLPVVNNVDKNIAIKKVHDRHLVRVDNKLQKIDAFLHKESESSSKKRKVNDQEPLDKFQYTIAKFRKCRQIRLTSVKNLQAEIVKSADQDLTNLIKEHAFVGIVNAEHVLIQHQTRLYLANTTQLSKELFYQILITDFGNFAMLSLSNPAPIYDLAMLGLNSEQSGWSPADGDKTDLAQFLVKFYAEKAEMLKDYFSLEIKNGAITGLPLLLSNYVPPMEGLAMLVLRLATEINWEDEKECFSTLCQELAKFYSVRKGFTDFEDVTEVIDVNMNVDENKNMDELSFSEATSKSWQWTVEHIVYRAFKQHLLPPDKLLTSAGILQLANLSDLYKVFERC